MRIAAMIAALAFALPATAQETDPYAFEEGSNAKTWNLYAEYPALFDAKVVDILCEITGDCPANCGDGARQLGLVRAVDNVLVFPNKNSQAAFTGASAELLPFCGMDVQVDGLLLDDPDLGATNIYLVQMIRKIGDEEWTTANSWTKKWAEAHPEAAGKGPWFRRDPRVLAEIAREGYFGLGQDRESAIKAEVFE